MCVCVRGREENNDVLYRSTIYKALVSVPLL